MNKWSSSHDTSNSSLPTSKFYNEDDFTKQVVNITQIRMEQETQKEADLQMVDTLKESLIDSNDLWYLNSFLILDPHTFDQDKEKWRRKLESIWIKEYIKSNCSDTDIISKVINIMTHYLHHYPFTDSVIDSHFKQLIQWHIWQEYAMIWKYSDALFYFKKLKIEWYDGVWNEYMDATISFLEKDKVALENIKLNIDQNKVSNGKFINQFSTFFDKTYVEAYSGMNMDKIQEFLKKKN